MKILTHQPPILRPQAPPSKQGSAQETTPRDVLATSCSLVGGALSLAGGVMQNPLLAAAGTGVFALGSALEAHRFQSGANLDGQFALNVGLGGSMVAGGLALLALGAPAAAQVTPLGQFLQQFPALGGVGY